DLRELKKAGLLADDTHRDGYYLVGPSFSASEAKPMLGALRVLAENLGSPLSSSTFDRVTRRMARTRNVELLAYPVEAIGNRLVIDTRQEEFRELVSRLETFIRMGREVTVSKFFHPWEAASHKETPYRVVPLQLLFHDLAWYLLAEDRADNQFKVFRLDRLRPAVTPADAPARGLEAQRRALDEARALLQLGWGVIIPPRGTTAESPDLVTVKVRFDAYAAQFIRESINRHPTQQWRRVGDTMHYTVRLHDISLDEFGRWVFGWGEHALVTEPASLRDKLAFRFAKAADYYRNG
ncbi:MAG: WYL domain-containing protein, partial [Candidatus Sericytochromatia bacterium]|nr:WYL domain-containing protein [Candidatus Tanganyikabacteria bacterium]